MGCRRAVSVSVHLGADDPGTIGRVLGSLTAAGVRIDGNAKSGNTLRVLTSDPDAARDVLRKLGLACDESEVVVIDVPEIGAIAHLLQQLSSAGISVTYMYLVHGARIVVCTSDLDALLAVVAKAVEAGDITQ